MTQEQLRKECERLFACSNLTDSNELLEIYSEFLFRTIHNHHHEKIYTQAEADAKIILQMIFTKVLHIKNAISGISFKSSTGSNLNTIIDPTVIASLTRNLYETVGMFNLIYINTRTEEERRILYLLWVHAGLKYRQRFNNALTTAENIAKYEHEKQQLDVIVQEIEDTAKYKSLNEKNQAKIKTKLKDKDYLIEFSGTDILFLHWHDLTRVMGVKDGLLENMYTYFSLYAHPSQVSVFQFADMFQRGSEAFPQIVNFHLKNAIFFISIFIADYIKLFPSVLSTFESLDLKDQIAINFHNTLARSYDYSINDSYKAVS